MLQFLFCSQLYLFSQKILKRWICSTSSYPCSNLIWNKNSLTLFFAWNSFTYDSLSESVTVFIIPINQFLKAIKEVISNAGYMYFSNGLLHTNFINDANVNIRVNNMNGRIGRIINKAHPNGMSSKNLN